MNSNIFSIVSARSILAEIAANASKVSRQIIKESLATLEDPNKGIQALGMALDGGEFTNSAGELVKFDSCRQAVYVQTESSWDESKSLVFEHLADCFVGWCEDTKKADESLHVAKVDRINKAIAAYADKLASERGVQKASKSDKKLAETFYKSDVECRKVTNSLRRDKVESLRSRVIRAIKEVQARDYTQGINEVSLEDLLNVL